MGFEDFLERKDNYRENYNKQRYYNDDRYSHQSDHLKDSHNDHQKWIGILDKIRNNKKLKWFIIIAGILVLIAGVALIIVLLPIIVKLFNYISQNGINGVLNDITGFLEKIWNGSGK